MIPQHNLQRVLEHHRTLNRGEGIGSWDRINICVRTYVLPCNAQRYEAQLPFILYYRLGFNGTFQIITSRLDFLNYATAAELDFLVSDTRWLGGTINKIGHTCMLAQKLNGHFIPVIASLSSCENQFTIAAIVKAIQDCRPCKVGGCNHPIVVATDSVTTKTYRRDCPQPLPFNVRINTDKSLSAAKGITDSGATNGIDPFHHYVATSARLTELRLPTHHVAAGVDYLHRVAMRALNQGTKDRCIDNVILYIERWNNRCSTNEHLSQEEFLAIRNYLRQALGYSGTAWEGAIGDQAGYICTVAGESHFSSYITMISKGLVESNPTIVICDRFLGISPNGNPTTADNYWEVHSRREGTQSHLKSTSRNKREAD